MRTKHLFYWFYRYLLVYLAITIFPFYTLAQTDKKDSTLYYQKIIKPCNDLLTKNKTDEAIICFLERSQNSNVALECYWKLADIYYSKKDKANTLYYINKAIDFNADKSYTHVINFIKKLYANKDNHLALLVMNRLSVSNIKEHKIQTIETTKKKITNRQLLDKTYDVTRKLIHLGDSINSKEPEYLPSLTLDENTMIFTRKIHGANEDFFISTKDTNGKWTKAKNMGYPPNTSYPDGGAKISADGNYIFFTRCDMKSPDGRVGGGCDLVFCYKEADTTWSAPQYFGFTINTSSFEGQPCLSSDNKDLYFVSNRDGGFGGMDIYVSHFNENGYWTVPKNLGATINTSGNEITPFIHPDNQTFYFSSDTHNGFGKSDIFVSKKTNDTTWSKPQNIGYPINSEKEDAGLVVSIDGNEAYISSDNVDTKGSFDIYKVSLSYNTKPIPTVCLKGNIVDKKEKTYLKNVEISIQDSKKQLAPIDTKSNKGDGSFMFALHRKKTYQLAIKKYDYRDYYLTIPLYSDTIKNIITKKIKLKRIGVLDTLFKHAVQLDTTLIKPDSISCKMLDSIVNTWSYWKEENASIQVYISNNYICESDTDTMCEKNISTALNNIKIIFDYIKRNGIPCSVINENTVQLRRKEEDEMNDSITVMVVEYY